MGKRHSPLLEELPELLNPHIGPKFSPVKVKDRSGGWWPLRTACEHRLHRHVRVAAVEVKLWQVAVPCQVQR